MGLLSAAVTSVQEFMVRVGERTHTVRVEGDRAIVDGVALTVVASPGGRSLVRSDDGHGQRAVTLDGLASPVSASVGGVASKLELRTAQEAALAAAMSSGRAGGAAGSQLKAPMPGRVVRVLVSVGQAVERGASVVIVEAMKMENELRAPAAGVVLRVHASEGAAVDAGQLLVELELA
jgi:biotin carboxyl carrier protein